MLSEMEAEEHLLRTRLISHSKREFIKGIGGKTRVVVLGLSVTQNYLEGLVNRFFLPLLPTSF